MKYGTIWSVNRIETKGVVRNAGWKLEGAPRNALPRNAIQLERIQRWKDVGRKLSDGHRFPGAHDEVRQQHHPSGEITDHWRKNLCGVGGLAGSVRKPLHPLAINVADVQK